MADTAVLERPKISDRAPEVVHIVCSCWMRVFESCGEIESVCGERDKGNPTDLEANCVDCLLLMSNPCKKCGCRKPHPNRRYAK